MWVTVHDIHTLISHQILLKCPVMKNQDSNSTIKLDFKIYRHTFPKGKDGLIVFFRKERKRNKKKVTYEKVHPHNRIKVVN